MQSNELIKGTLTTILLTLLKENGKMYGYEITQAVKERTGGRILLKEGSLYPALHRLSAEGLIESEQVMMGRRVRIYYRLTARGRTRTKAQVQELAEFLQAIQQLILPERPFAHG